MLSYKFLPPFIFPQGGKVNPLLPPWGKVGKGVLEVTNVSVFVSILNFLNLIVIVKS